MARITDHGSRFTPSDLWTVVPVRGIAEGKSRLAGVLDPPARARLNRQLLERTLRTVADWRGESGRCAVVSACRETLSIARQLGAVVIDEGAETGGLNAAAARGAAYAAVRGAQGILVLPCDLPYLNAGALTAMLEAAAPAHHMVLAPDRHGAGTNALLLCVAESFEFRFGEGSCAAHLALAARRGWRAALCRRTELEFDLDTPEDLLRWMETRAEAGQHT